MDSCQKVDIDTGVMSSLLKKELFTLLLAPLWFLTPAECCTRRDINTSGLKGITLRLSTMTPSCYLQNRSGGKKKKLLKMLLSPRMLTAEGV